VNALKLAWSGLVRELRAGLLTTMLMALIVAVAAVSAVGFFTDRVDGGMRAQAAEFLAADARIDSPDPLDAVRRQARELGLETTDTLVFPTVILAGERTLLVGLKAVGKGYPMRGSLTIAADAAGSVDRRVVTHAPAPGQVWLAPRALALLDLKVGDTVQIGRTHFRIAAALIREPDVGNVFSQAAPRAMIPLADIPATGLVTPASRVRHHLLLAAPTKSRKTLLDRLAKDLPKGLSLDRPENSQPEFKTAFDRAARFLGLAAMVAVLLSGAALLLAARHYNRVQQDAVALMRAFGASSRQIGRIYLLRLLILALLAAVPGLLIGVITQAGLADLMARVVNVTLPPPGFRPVLTGVGISLVALFGFALPSLLRLKDTPPLRVLNQQVQAPTPAALLLFGVGLAAMALLVWFQARDASLTGYVLLGLLVSLIVFLGLSWLLLAAVSRWPAQGVARFGLARLARDRFAGSAQLTALALGLTALLLLGVVRADLLDAWRAQIPVDAPNTFAINIQPDQVSGIQAFLDGHDLSSAGIYPMIRARWVTYDGKPVDAKKFTGQSRRLAEREFNLSYTRHLPSDNRVLAGKWFGPTADTGWSVEEGIAKRFGWKVGDRLGFAVNGSTVQATVTSIRKVQWDSMRPNFFVIAAPPLLQSTPAQYVTSFHLPAGDVELQKALLTKYPTLTLFDLTRILQEVRTLIDRASQAVQYVFAFTILAGLVVLFAAFQASERGRIRDAAVLRTLGASRRQLARTLWVEFLAVGVLSGLLATVAAGALGAVLSWRLFDLPWRLDPWLAFYGLGAGLLLAIILVPLLSRRMAGTPPAQALRG